MGLNRQRFVLDLKQKRIKRGRENEKTQLRNQRRNTRSTQKIPSQHQPIKQKSRHQHVYHRKTPGRPKRLRKSQRKHRMGQRQQENSMETEQMSRIKENLLNSTKLKTDSKTVRVLQRLQHKDLTPSDVEDVLSIGRNGALYHLKKLESLDLADRTNPADKQAKPFKITRKGKAELRKHREKKGIAL